MNSILERIAQHKRDEVAFAKKKRPLSALRDQEPMEQRNFVQALDSDATPSIIAEIKKASPSKGIIREDFDVVDIAKTYATHGAKCLSVLTDTHFFQGHPDYLPLAKKQCQLPVLRKDFMIDPYQIHESYALGADCILLIVALLDDVELLDFCQLAQELGMAALVESHTQEELVRAIKLPTPLMGINNRSLHTFTTDIQLSIELKPLVPEDKKMITESGINTPEDIQMMRKHGINAFLIGECLMRAPDIGNALQRLIYP